MNSYDVQVHQMTDTQLRRALKSWVKPSVEVIALKTAECGNGNPGADLSSSCHVSRNRS